MRVLVTGATGFVGDRLVSALRAAGNDVVVLVGDADRYDPPAGVEVRRADLLDPPVSLPSVDAAFYLARAGRRDADDRDRLAARSFVDAAADAGVDRVVYLARAGARTASAPAARREVEHILDGGDHDLTTLRTAAVVGAGSTTFGLIRQIAGRLPVILTPGWVRTDRQPIYVDDLLEYLLGVLEAPATRNGSFEVGGPDVLTYETMLERTAEIVAGRRVPVVPVPVTSPRLSAGWLWLVTDVSLSAARSTVADLRNTVVVADDSIRRHVDVELTPFDEAVRAVVGDRPTATAAPAAGEA